MANVKNKSSNIGFCTNNMESIVVHNILGVEGSLRIHLHGSFLKCFAHYKNHRKVIICSQL